MARHDQHDLPRDWRCTSCRQGAHGLCVDALLALSAAVRRAELPDPVCSCRCPDQVLQGRTS